MNFHGEKRSLQTHESKSEPEALLARKGAGKEAKLSYSGNPLVENGNGLIVSGMGSDGHGRTPCGEDPVAGCSRKKAVLKRSPGALDSAKNHPQNAQHSEMTQTRSEIARPAQFFSSLLRYEYAGRSIYSR